MDEFIKIKTDCLAKKIKWCDPDFPPEITSLFYHQVPNVEFEWKRPADIHESPVFFDDTFDGFDLDKGPLGDSWLMSCMEVLHKFKGIFKHVVPVDQDFRSNYAGIFRFRIWWNGKWEVVMVDDRLPTVNGNLVFTYNTHGNQLWAALLEKAYAKWLGSYEALKYGNENDGLMDLTGGIVESSSLPLLSQVELLHKFLNSVSSIALAYAPLGPGPFESITNSKLFFIYEIDKVQTSDGFIYIVRIVVPNLLLDVKECNRYIERNYKAIWDTLSASKRNEIFSNEQGFWVPFSELEKIIICMRLLHFDIQCCLLEPTIMYKNKWFSQTRQGNWIKGVTAGDTFHLNPQYQVVINKQTPVIISIQQSNLLESQVIGFTVYKLRETINEKASASLLDNMEGSLNGYYSNARHVSAMAVVDPGNYLVVPTTYEPRKEGRFTIRILSLKPILVSTEMDFRARVLRQIVFKVDSLKNGNILKPYNILFLQSADEDKTVDAFGLQDVLEKSLPNDFIRSCATIETCRQIILGMETPIKKDLTGRIHLKSYQNLLISLWYWEEIFSLHTKKTRGVLVVEKLHAALSKVGFRLSNKLMAILVFKYMRRDGTLRFGDFVSAIFYLKTIWHLPEGF
ncbi:calpain-C isoform X2 [Pieris rapae]|uniref:calpain-C isoform X2 n=1 Tax=Pieris rapae TaxID=64459 RepID=UPI001E27EC62|nr:calpain-C isoform X2 [Pieris rapae]